MWMSSCTVFVFASLLQFGLVNYFMDAEPLTKDMTGYSVEDLTDLDDKKVRFGSSENNSLSQGGTNSFESSECSHEMIYAKKNRRFYRIHCLMREEGPGLGTLSVICIIFFHSVFVYRVFFTSVHCRTIFLFAFIPFVVLLCYIYFIKFVHCILL